MKPDKEAFERVCKELEFTPLNLKMIGDIFGQEFWMLIVLCLVDDNTIRQEREALAKQIKG